MVATVLEEAPRVPGSDRRERSADRLYQGLAGAGFGLAQQPLDLGEGLLDEPTTVRLYTAASSSGYKVIASLWLDPLPVGMVSTGQFLQPAKPLQLRLVGPHHPTSSVALQLSAPYQSATDPRV